MRPSIRGGEEHYDGACRERKGEKVYDELVRAKRIDTLFEKERDGKHQGMMDVEISNYPERHTGKRGDAFFFLN